MTYAFFVRWVTALLVVAALASPAAAAKKKKQAKAKAKEKPKAVAGVKIGTTSTGEGSITLKLVHRFQNYDKHPDDAADVHDEAVWSPKSARYSADGKKIYVNSLEGFQTVVYDAAKLEKITTIKHVFGDAEQGLFLETDVFDYAWIAKPDDGKPNHFKGKPVESELSHGGRYLWVPYYRRNWDLKSQSPSAVAIIDTKKDEIVRVMPTGPIPKYVKASPDSKWMVVAHWGDNTVMLIDTSNEDPLKWKHHKLLVVGTRVNLAKVKSRDRDKECSLCLRGMEFSRDGAYLFVARMGGGGVAVFDMATLDYVGTGFGMQPTPRHLIVTEDGEWLYLSSNKSGHVSRVKVADLVAAVKKDARAKVEFEACAVGAGARTIDFAGKGRYVIAAVNNGSKLVAVDTSTMKVAATVPVDSFPVGLAVSPDGKQLFVTSQGRSGHGGNSVGVYAIDYAAE
jgi:DNA-binding beta-propeller fold protein YncE